MPTITAIVPAAGCGARAGQSGNKILAPLHGHPLLHWTLRALTAPDAMPPGATLLEVILAARPEEFGALQEVTGALGEGCTVMRLVEGGATRQESVANATRVAKGDYLLVHDAARPLIASTVIAQVCQAALESGAAIAAVPASDTVKLARAANGLPVVATTPDRAAVWLAQTPQVFRHELLTAAFAAAAAEGFTGTDCASVVERWIAQNSNVGPGVRLVEGDTLNFKITYAADLDRAATLLAAAFP